MKKSSGPGRDRLCISLILKGKGKGKGPFLVEDRSTPGKSLHLLTIFSGPLFELFGFMGVVSSLGVL